MARRDDIPSELDAEDVSPFRRRTREVVVRRGRVPRRLGAILKWISLTALLLAPLVYVGYELAAYALTSPRFSVRSAEDVVVACAQLADLGDGAGHGVLVALRAALRVVHGPETVGDLVAFLERRLE